MEGKIQNEKIYLKIPMIEEKPRENILNKDNIMHQIVLVVLTASFISAIIFFVSSAAYEFKNKDIDTYPINVYTYMEKNIANNSIVLKSDSRTKDEDVEEKYDDELKPGLLPQHKNNFIETTMPSDDFEDDDDSNENANDETQGAEINPGTDLDILNDEEKTEISLGDTDLIRQFAEFLFERGHLV